MKYSKLAQVEFVNNFAMQNLELIRDELEEKLKHTQKFLKSVDQFNIFVDTNQKQLETEIRKSLDR